ncbi:hypothetical protein F5Y17DRAFT_318429 [Xylariaceae sp. FL0594]|nr:hypothetical protein F5Y17DRAFT_318429 [Xylariaceae sp. FL0594]
MLFPIFAVLPQVIPAFRQVPESRTDRACKTSEHISRATSSNPSPTTSTTPAAPPYCPTAEPRLMVGQGGARKFFSELSGLEYFIVRHVAVLTMLDVGARGGIEALLYLIGLLLGGSDLPCRHLKWSYILTYISQIRLQTFVHLTPDTYIAN